MLVHPRDFVLGMLIVFVVGLAFWVFVGLTFSSVLR